MAVLSLRDYYLDLNNTAATVVNLVCDDGLMLSRQSQSHNYLSEYLSLSTAVSARPETAMLEAALQEYQYALYALVSGLYRHAFMSLRLTIELALSSVFYSAHEIRYRRWLNGIEDVNWAAVIDPEQGLFSKNYINAFSPAFADAGPQYRAIAATTYRECSEFVHGNRKTHEQVGTNVELKQDLFMAWHNLADSAHLTIVFAFAARFAPYLDKSALSTIQAILTDTLGDLPAIQALYA